MRSAELGAAREEGGGQEPGRHPVVGGEALHERVAVDRPGGAADLPETRRDGGGEPLAGVDRQRLGDVVGVAEHGSVPRETVPSKSNTMVRPGVLTGGARLRARFLGIPRRDPVDAASTICSAHRRNDPAAVNGT
ncbi:hypothetical protein BC477_01900 [Clavibacter michiganensis subsp. michiganensis]|uniref:Uncharacterized protein n=1 Tax=Clavibacter michiganensis subsp. michiganensis TaxID=33013 RepID=A0A251XIY8_CLAMM|nr:hypothetical protein BC477_01900 [Clavibacter michiganensis subsp. michiganensis]OUE03462.1 hypothetical protein CMMCAS07_00835 [Clavibacter michiganensis subsp. michiganensis]